MFKLAALLPPPTHTLAAAKQHSCRTYHQVQQWLKEQKDPLKRGWKTIGGYLRPITATHSLSFAPAKMNAYKTASVEGVVSTAETCAAIAQDWDASTETC
ncbi:hypothetical protein AVEN_158159-1 [Araneus ventricosus]|uniref:Uncharacterized protein n=1 Tax=Araneus ventricosus TaxID=182803 RepID=A0A4Y2I853_ARAVE|nr:hypothetical protein AVEN_158159-1 [Araneus ventricosus]